ncbi:unnamed protein product [Soboliphyme baturini]|uniref:Endo/exonuclease/phosphatase domain-containing protein n=1 Tax=Soboliphyme baturini TaxID=241478 RepID=A0A183IC78_9BILA|nr:unnamed protein product [Soboliphyme baturini]
MRQISRCHYSITEKVPRERHHQGKLKVGNWNVTSLRGKEQELVDEAIKHQLDIVGLSLTKREGSGFLNLNGWKLFYVGVDITTRAQASVGVVGEYDFFLEEVECALNELPNTEALKLLGDFNEHVGIETEKCKGVIGKNGPCSLSNNGMQLLRFWANKGLSIMNSFFEHRRVISVPDTAKLLIQKSIIN